MDTWRTEDAVRLATDYVHDLGDRWMHVRAVGRKAEALGEICGLPDWSVDAAWLHDIGHSPRIALTGFHPLDGATFLETVGAPPPVVAAVALHSGAGFEAEERELSAELARFYDDVTDALDVVTLVDMTTGPTGHSVAEVDRLAEILARYPDEDPVHRAVVRSRESIVASCARARRMLDLPDKWCGSSVKVVLDSHPH